MMTPTRPVLKATTMVVGTLAAGLLLTSCGESAAQIEGTASFSTDHVDAGHEFVEHLNEATQEALASPNSTASMTPTGNDTTDAVITEFVEHYYGSGEADIKGITSELAGWAEKPGSDDTVEVRFTVFSEFPREGDEPGSSEAGNEVFSGTLADDGGWQSLEWHSTVADLNEYAESKSEGDLPVEPTFD